MNDYKLDYEEFYNYVWDSSNLSRIVSISYQEQNKDYIRNITFEIFNLYEKANLPERIALKILEINFFNLFRFKPDESNIEEIEDNYKDF